MLSSNNFTNYTMAWRASLCQREGVPVSKKVLPAASTFPQLNVKNKSIRPKYINKLERKKRYSAHIISLLKTPGYLPISYWTEHPTKLNIQNSSKSGEAYLFRFTICCHHTLTHTHTLNIPVLLIVRSPVPLHLLFPLPASPSLMALSFQWALPHTSWLSSNATASGNPFLTLPTKVNLTLLPQICVPTPALYEDVSLSLSFSTTRTWGLSEKGRQCYPSMVLHKRWLDD